MAGKLTNAAVQLLCLLCACASGSLTSNHAGAAYCWGSNSNGQLGDGTTTQRTSPTLVAGGLGFVALSAGASHTCGVTALGTYCWGSNDNGQLGNGSTTDSSVPVKVAGPPQSETRIIRRTTQ
jgi:alpha-tubulin suppressor-like RCC1 family protein